jgi:hypothetical protein
MLFHINDHVKQDVEDAILLMGFEGMTKKSIQVKITEHKEHREEVDKVLNSAEETVFKLNDERRDFLNSLMRPPVSWNFFVEEEAM